MAKNKGIEKGLGAKQKKRKTEEQDKGGPLDARQSESLDSRESSGVVQSNRIVICKQTGCHDISTTFGFCRLHYLFSWKKLKSKEAKRQGQELDAYLADLARKFPEDFLERIKAEVEDANEREKTTEADDDSDRSGIFDPMDGDEDLDTIIKGLKVEDF